MISIDFFGVPRRLAPERWRKTSESSVSVSRAPSRNCISAEDFWCVRTPSRSTSMSPSWAFCQGMGEGWSSTCRESRLRRAAGRLDSTEGMRIRRPGEIQCGSRMSGFRRWISVHRSADPRNWAAIPSSVSPGRTVCQPVCSGAGEDGRPCANRPIGAISRVRRSTENGCFMRSLRAAAKRTRKIGRLSLGSHPYTNPLWRRDVRCLARKRSWWWMTSPR